MRGLGERGTARLAIAVVDLARDVAGPRGPARRRAGIERRERRDDRRQRFVIDLDRVGSIPCRGARLGDHRGHGFTDETNGLESERPTWRRFAWATVGTL